MALLARAKALWKINKSNLWESYWSWWRFLCLKNQTLTNVEADLRSPDLCINLDFLTLVKNVIMICHVSWDVVIKLPILNFCNRAWYNWKNNFFYFFYKRWDKKKKTSCLPFKASARSWKRISKMSSLYIII
jgi:hypothetical protein